MLERLSQGLRNTFNKIKNALFADEKLINEVIRDLQKVLIQSDVNIKLVFSLSQKIKERIKKEQIPGLTKKEMLIKLIYDELVNLLGGEEEKIEITKKPFKIMLIGLFGSGKTTQAAKLANYYSKRGYKVALLQLDVYRPAAYEQLEQLGKKINVKVYGDKTIKDPIKIYEMFENELKNYDIIIIDTAGRDALSKELIEELNKLYDYIKPDEVLLVISADIGQTAEKQAKAFNESCKITGVIVTKMDGTAKGGGALVACSVTNAKVKFIGTGEKINDIETFSAKRFISRLIGYGDLEGLLEKAQEAIKEEEAKDLTDKFLKGEFNLLDMYKQIEMMQKMGPLTKIIQMIPGLSSLQIPKEVLEVQQEKLKKWKYAIDSMTKKELENPEIINSSRIERIAKGSGVDEQLIREMLKHYKKSKKLMKMIKGKNIKNMKDISKLFVNKS